MAAGDEGSGREKEIAMPFTVRRQATPMVAIASHGGARRGNLAGSVGRKGHHGVAAALDERSEGLVDGPDEDDLDVVAGRFSAR